MSVSRCPLYIVVLAFLLTRGNGGRTVITPENSSVIEHSTLRLDCFYTDYSALPTTTTCRWSIDQNGTTRMIAIFYENCLLRNYFEEIYSFECTNKTANSLIINSTDRSLHGTVFSCSYIVNGTPPVSGHSTIRVSVPVSSVNLIQPESDVVITTENKKVAFTCNASASHPKPNITWYIDSKAPLDYKSVEITKNITEAFDYDGYLYTVMSNLSFYPTKYDNDSRIYCKASNTERNISSTRKALLYVQYPPSVPAFFTRSNVSVQNVAVIINNTLMIRCKSNGNPFPSYKWTTSQNNEVFGGDLNINNIRKNDEGMYSCMAYNEFATEGGKYNYNTSASIEVTVLFPPDSPNLYYLRPGITEAIFNSTLKVVKGDSVSILCNSTGKPPPVSGWIGAKLSDTLSLSSIKADTDYTCTSSNVMTETEGRTKKGLESRQLQIHALYPPRNPVAHIQLQSDATAEALNYTGILEGSDFTLYCDAVSNPPPSYKWTGPATSNHMSYTAELFVRNIQRNQSGPYICYAQNKMERSFGNIEIGRNSQSIYFNILYKAAIEYFSAADFEINKNMMTVNQSKETRIICRVESNPFSNSTIFFKGRLVNETIHSDTVTYNLVNSKCSDAGRYICKSKNEYNYEADASKELILYVKCLPQPSTDQQPEKNVSAAPSDSAVFRFHAAPYYDPGITEFRWFKQENESRILLRNGEKTYISSSDIHSVLRISDISKADYGMYILEYNNSAGMNIFTFYLQQINQTVSEEIHQGNDKNYLPIIIGIVIAVLVIVGITLGIVIYIRRYKQKTDSSNGDRSYDDVCGVNTKSGGNNRHHVPVYEGLTPIDERGYVEMKDQAYDILKPKDSPDPKDPVYTNLKL